MTARDPAMIAVRDLQGSRAGPCEAVVNDVRRLAEPDRGKVDDRLAAVLSADDDGARRRRFLFDVGQGVIAVRQEDTIARQGHGHGRRQRRRVRYRNRALARRKYVVRWTARVRRSVSGRSTST